LSIYQTPCPKGHSHQPNILNYNQSACLRIFQKFLFYTYINGGYLSPLVERFCLVFNADTLSGLARFTKFVQRSSKICAVKFLDLLFKDASSERGMSLLDYSNELHVVHGVCVSTSAIDKRFNDYAVQFFRRLVNILFCAQIRSPFDDSFLRAYTAVRIWDSTKIELPAHMAADFPGFGGSASDAGISIQYRYDLKNAVGSSLDVFPATSSDSGYTKEIPVEKNALEIFDLGYVSADFLSRLDEGGSYYVCRVHSQADVYDLDGQKIDLEKIYRWMRLYRIPVYQKRVLVGQKLLPSRLVITLVDEQTYQKRLRNVRKDAGKRGWQISDQHKLRMRMNLMITNTDSEEIPAEKVYMLYKFRWQIELIFKTWKSAGWNLGKIKEVKYERYMCVMYAKLLMIILSERIYNVIAAKRYSMDKKTLSREKCVKTMCRQINLLRQFINTEAYKIYEILDKISKIFARGHILCQRKNRENYSHLVELFIYKSK
jgi:hypothetical protein